MELRVGNKYRLGRKIGSGSFGEIYQGTFAFFVKQFILKRNEYSNEGKSCYKVGTRQNKTPAVALRI